MSYNVNAVYHFASLGVAEGAGQPGAGGAEESPRALRGGRDAEAHVTTNTITHINNDYIFITTIIIIITTIIITTIIIIIIDITIIIIIIIILIMLITLLLLIGNYYYHEARGGRRGPEGSLADKTNDSILQIVGLSGSETPGVTIEVTIFGILF